MGSEVTDLVIRDVTLADADAIVAILNPIIQARAYTVFDTPFSVDAERDYIARLSPRGIWKVAVAAHDHRVIGFQVMEPYATYTQGFAHVGTLGTYVDLNLRRHGIARRLFAATFEAAIAKGYEKAFTFVRADNPAALQTYLAQGFVVVGMAKRQLRLDGAYIDEILIEKWLQ
jgi:L-amino acid N-acyltransferase YncA